MSIPPGTPPPSTPPNDDTASLLSFPDDFLIKAMGRNDADFQTLVIELVKPHAPDLDVSLITARESSGGRYLSVTLTVHATERAQLDAIYQTLSDDPRVVMAL